MCIMTTPFKQPFWSLLTCDSRVNSLLPYCVSRSFIFSTEPLLPATYKPILEGVLCIYLGKRESLQSWYVRHLGCGVSQVLVGGDSPGSILQGRSHKEQHLAFKLSPTIWVLVEDPLPPYVPKWLCVTEPPRTPTSLLPIRLYARGN